MIADVHPLLQTLLGTLFTWGLTALGSGLVFVFHSGQRKILDGSLGFAAGVMTAASYWSLLAPAIEMAERSGNYGSEGQWAFIPVAIGFVMGAAFVYGADIFMPLLGAESTTGLVLSLDPNQKLHKDGASLDSIHVTETHHDDTGYRPEGNSSIFQRKRGADQPISYNSTSDLKTGEGTPSSISWRRIMLLIIAITIHNIPEGLAVGVGFGAIGKSPAATFENARNLAIGIGIQNFPEGLAVSLPLKGSGMSTLKCFWYGQLSGIVEPIAGLFGALAVVIAEPILPYALAFAAGAMIYVVVDDIIPEAQTCGNGKLASWTAIVGFVVMMMLDVGLG
ncbi:zinc transporter ZIP11-like [Dreissena polymorpha]|uniref:zinc transporter ZIP11-like n=1 Tax=Dreissena polymorpha TaxID=45954 RepID=UPI00226538F5|nr:zinc transporter ZIP11-like [Dreissena polymorpha]